MMLARSVCMACGLPGVPEKKTPGSVIIEIILWCCFLVPGLIYSIWRLTSKYERCRGCQGRTMVLASSPNGAALLEKNGGWSPIAEQTYRDAIQSRLLVRSVGNAVLWAFVIWSAAVGYFVFAALCAILVAIPTLFLIGEWVEYKKLAAHSTSVIPFGR
jgi:hypothetical protein